MNREDYLQEQAESGRPDGSIDSMAYRKVFDALKKDSTPALSPAFADRIVAMVSDRQSSRASRLMIFLAIAGGSCAIGLLVVATILTGFKVRLGFMEPLREFGGMFLFGIAFILLLNWLDKSIIRKKASV